ncbi:MAG: NAD(P)H-hydrate dehydratase [bacterium]
MPDKILYQKEPLYPKLLWQRPVHYYKPEAGMILVIAGSRNSPGLAILTCEAVFRSGTGTLMLGFPESLKDVYKKILPDSMALPLLETPSHTLSQKSEDELASQAKACDAVIIGPGLSQNSETIQLIWRLIFAIDKPILLDDDGVSALITGIEVLKSRNGNDFLLDYFHKKVGILVLSLDSGDAYRILQLLKPVELEDIKVTLDYVRAHKKEIAPMLAKYLDSYLILKGFEIIICSPGGKLVINQTIGTESIQNAKGVLSGIVGSFISQNPTQLFEACCTGVYLYSLANQIAYDETNKTMLEPSDIIRFLPNAIKHAENII